jgi:hypothetical protein
LPVTCCWLALEEDALPPVVPELPIEPDEPVELDPLPIEPDEPDEPDEVSEGLAAPDDPDDPDEPAEPDDPVPDDDDPEEPGLLLAPLDCAAAGSAMSRLATPRPATIPLLIFIGTPSAPFETDQAPA